MGDVDVPASHSNFNSGLSELEQFEKEVEQKVTIGDGADTPAAPPEEDFSGELC